MMENNQKPFQGLNRPNSSCLMNAIQVAHQLLTKWPRHHEQTKASCAMVYTFSLLLSCHKTALFHLSTHFLAFWLNFRRSSKVKGCASNGHCNICLMVSKACPHSHVVSPLKHFHLFRCSLPHVTPVRNLLRHLHAAQGLVFPFARLSSRLIDSAVV